MTEQMPFRDTKFEPPTPEGRWGDVDKILQTLSEGQVTRVLRIEDVVPDINPDHTNVVDYAEIDPGDAHTNIIEELEIQLNGTTLQCVFKPQKGEFQERIRKCQEKTGDSDIENFYTREVAAFLIDEHFGFEVVLPTVIRNIPGHGVGALRPFIDPSLFSTAADWPANIEQRRATKDYQKIALLDWITANFDRKQEDYFVREDDPESLIAIDNGYALMHTVYHHPETVDDKGPMFLMTCDVRTNQLTSEQISEDLLEQIRQAIARRSELDEELKALGIPDKDIEAMWVRAQALVDSGKFLSRQNTRLVDINQYEIEVQ